MVLDLICGWLWVTTLPYWFPQTAHTALAVQVAGELVSWSARSSRRCSGHGAGAVVLGVVMLCQSPQMCWAGCWMVKVQASAVKPSGPVG